MDQALTRSSRMLAIGGVAALVFGIAVLAVPSISLVALISLFGAYALVTGLSSLGAGIHFAIERQHHWVPYALGGVAGIAMGAITFFRPGITVIALVYYIAVWAIVIGIFEIAAAFDLGSVTGQRWALALSGLLSVLFGAAVAIYPAGGRARAALGSRLLLDSHACHPAVLRLSSTRRPRRGQDDREQGGRRAAVSETVREACEGQPLIWG